VQWLYSPATGLANGDSTIRWNALINVGCVNGNSEEYLLAHHFQPWLRSYLAIEGKLELKVVTIIRRSFETPRFRGLVLY
jgi:hypothetical protein